MEEHQFFDICECPDCLADDYEEIPHRKKKSIKQRYDEGDSSVGTLGEPSGKFDYLVYYSCPKKKPDYSSIPPSPCTPKQKRWRPKLSPVPSIAMYRPANNYDANFPSLEDQNLNQTRTIYQVKNPTSTDAKGRPKVLSNAEAVLNWQSENVVS